MRRLSGTRNMIIYFLVYCGSLLGQDYDLEGSYPKIIRPFHLPIIQIAHPNNQAHPTPGWIMTMQYPGFSSLMGEYSVGRTSEAGNSFSIGIGWAYFVTELNVKTVQMERGIIFSNFVAGALPAYYNNRFFHFGIFGSFGTSYATDISPSTHVQLSLDGLFHNGLKGEQIIQDTPEMHGLQAGVALNKQVSSHISISINGGVAYQKYRYWHYRSSRYIHYPTRRWTSDEYSEIEEGWQAHISFPLSVAVQVKF